MLPIRNAVLFPGAVAPFDVGREKSVALVEDVADLPGPVIGRDLRPARSLDRRSRRGEDLYPAGCAARVLKALKHSPGNYSSSILQALTRIRLEAVTWAARPAAKAKVRPPRRAARARGRRGRGPRDEPARHRRAGDPAHAPSCAREAAARPDRLHPGPRRPRRPRSPPTSTPPARRRPSSSRPSRSRSRILQGAPGPALTRQARDPRGARASTPQIKEEMGKNQREYVPSASSSRRSRRSPARTRATRGDPRDGLEDRIAKANLPDRGGDGRQEASSSASARCRLGLGRGVHGRAHVP